MAVQYSHRTAVACRWWWVKASRAEDSSSVRRTISEPMELYRYIAHENSSQQEARMHIESVRRGFRGEWDTHTHTHTMREIDGVRESVVVVVVVKRRKIDKQGETLDVEVTTFSVLNISEARKGGRYSKTIRSCTICGRGSHDMSENSFSIKHNGQDSTPF